MMGSTGDGRITSHTCSQGLCTCIQYCDTTYTAPVYCDVLYIYMFVHNSITLLLNKAPVCWGISLSSPAHCPCHDLAAIIGTKEGTCLPELIS